LLGIPTVGHPTRGLHRVVSPEKEEPGGAEGHAEDGKLSRSEREEVAGLGGGFVGEEMRAQRLSRFPHPAATPNLISLKVFLESFCKIQFPNRSLKSFFVSVIIKDALTDLNAN